MNDMSDPRIAALAEALSATMERPDSGVAWPTRWTHDDFAWVARQLAAAILAALPPDWCGHDAAWMVAKHGRDEAEIARLRAALEIIAAPPESATIDAIPVAARNIARHALRAALEADR